MGRAVSELDAARTAPTRAPTSDAATVEAAATSDAGYISGGAAHTELVAGAHVDRYVIERRLGAGGMGVVYAARDPDLDRRVAIKLVAAGVRRTRPHLLREGQAAARLRHPNVVAIHDVGDHGDDVFIAMELIEGRTLRRWLGERKRSWREMLAVFVPAGRGLAAAHAAGLVHRDFKPDNVLVADDGRVLVTDFGLARLERFDDELGEPRATAGDDGEIGDTTRTVVAGTPAYMSPEQFLGHAIDARSDQFSFCVALFEALCGVRPFQQRAGAPPSFEELRAAVVCGRVIEPRGLAIPGRVRRALRRGLRAEPVARFPSMDALLAALAPSRVRWSWLAAALAAGVLAATALVVRAREGDADASCAAAARIDGLWNDGARAGAVHRAAGVPFASDDVAAIDRYTARWRDLRRAACRAPAGELAARRALCLDAALADLSRAIAHVGASGWASLPSLARCTGDRPDVAATEQPLGMYPGGADATALSQDGATLLRASHGRLDVVSIARGDRAQQPMRGEATELRATAHGVRYVDPTGVAAIDLATGATTPLGPAEPSDAVLSPSGDFVAFEHDRALWIAPIATGVPRRLAPLTGASLGIAWSPSSKQLAIASRVTAADMGTIRVVDATTGGFHDVPMRAPRALTRNPIPIAWLDDRRVIVDAEQDDAHGQSVWAIDVSGAPDAEPPEVRLPAPPGTAYTIYDAAGGRAVALRHQIHDHFGRLVDGTLQPMAGVGDGMSILALDGDGARVLTTHHTRDGAPDGTSVGWMSLADGVVTPVAMPPDAGRPALRGDHVVAVTGKAGAWRLEEQAADGRWQVLRALAAHGDAAPQITCGPPPANACVLVWRDAAWELATLDDPDRLIRLGDREAATIAVSPDGTRAAVGMLSGAVSVVDLARGTETRWAGVPGCYHQYLGWSRAGDGLYAGLVCKVDYRFVHMREGQDPEVLVRSKQWFGPFAIGAADELYVNQRVFAQDYVLLDGL